MQPGKEPCPSPVLLSETESCKDIVYMGKHSMRVEACLDFFGCEILAYLFILAEIFIEIFALEPSLHGIALYPAIRGIAIYPFGYQSQQYAGCKSGRR